MSRLVLFFWLAVASVALRAQDPAYGLLTNAYAALNAGDYDSAISYFNQALPLDRDRTGIREDLGYTYIKAGNDLAAMNLFYDVMTLDPTNLQAALQYAFLAYEQGDNDHISKARLVFLRVSQQATDPTMQATAATAFSAQVTSNGLQFSYSSNSRAFAVVNKQPVQVLVDGTAQSGTPQSNGQGGWAIPLPRGSHTASVQ